MRDVHKAIIEHKEFLISKGYKESQILGVFLYGSQNYGVATAKSDVDTKAIIIPSLKDLCLREKEIKELHLPNGEHCEVMDIRHLVQNFRKQNINFLEILYTKSCWVNFDYKHIWDKFFVANREDISHYDMNKAVASICGQAIHTIKQGPQNGKKISNGLRLEYFLKNYIVGRDYEDCIHPTDEKFRKRLIQLKKVTTLADTEQADTLIASFEKFKTISITMPQYVKTITDGYMEDGIIALVKKGMELNGEI